MTESNTAGTVVRRHSYTPYGEAWTAPVDGPGYTGHVMDAGTGLTYMQARYYDPEIGRFLSVDPVATNSSTGANFNRYKYAANNPYRFTDPDGRMDKETRDEMRRDRRSILAKSPGSDGLMATSARDGFSVDNAAERLQGTTRAVNKQKESMESVPNATLDDATRTFEKYMQPIASNFGVEIESLIDGQQVPPYYLEGTLVARQYDRATGVWARLDRPTAGLTTVHAHPLIGAQWQYSPFSPEDIRFYGRMPNRPHYLTDPSGAYRFDGEVTRISP